MDKERGYEILTDVVANERYHQDYERVTELSGKYFKLYTGKDLADLLLQIITRETREEFEQRKNITKSVIPSTLNSTKLPFQKALRKQPLMRELIYNGSKQDNKAAELEYFIATYWGDMSLEEYLEYAFLDYNYHDPNAFLITEFDEFNADKEKASPYPFIATSTEAVMFNYVNEILEYLIVRLPIKFTDVEVSKKPGGQIETLEVEKDGYKFTMYLGEDTIQITQVGQNFVTPEGYEVVKIGVNSYLLEFFAPKGEKVPARRLGFIRDAETKGRTFVSLFHAVLLLLEKGMKIDSELDLTTALTAFPQRYAYVDKCSEKGCQGGIMPGGDKCMVCNGTGKQPLHNSTMDVVTLSMPRTPEEMFDLDNLMIYKYPPIELLNFQKEYSTMLRSMVYSMMFNAEIYNQSEVQVAATATEKLLETDNLNDTLYPFARAYSQTWEFVVRDIAAFTDLGKGLKVHHKYPNDFKFKPLTELMNELKVARDAGASTSTIAAIEDDINELLYSDRPEDLKRIRVKNSVNPFRGYSEADVRLLIAQNKTTALNGVIWANLESIFNDLEIENPEIYDFATDKIRQLVRDKAAEYLAQITSERPAEVSSPFNTGE